MASALPNASIKEEKGMKAKCFQNALADVVINLKAIQDNLLLSVNQYPG